MYFDAFRRANTKYERYVILCTYPKINMIKEHAT